MLDKLMIKHGSDKSSKEHGYTKYYKEWFEKDFDWVHNADNILEIGVGGEDKELGGCSIKAWAEYFSHATIHAIDIYDKQELATDRIKIYQGSQDDPAFLNAICEHLPPFDIIIDDGSHDGKKTIASFIYLWDHVKPGGLYIIEDLFCSYRWDFGGDLNLTSLEHPTIMNYVLGLCHHLNPIQFADPQYVQRHIVKTIEAIEFRKNIVKIQKKER